MGCTGKTTSVHLIDTDGGNMCQLEEALEFARVKQDGIYFTKCASLENRIILGGVFSHSARVKTNSTKGGGNGLPGMRASLHPFPKLLS